MTKLNAPAPRRVAMLIYSGVTPMDVACPLEVFSFANTLRRETIYDVVTVAPTVGPVTTKAGVGFTPTWAMADLAFPVDTLMVSGGMQPREWVTQDMSDWLRGAALRSLQGGLRPFDLALLIEIWNGQPLMRSQRMTRSFENHTATDDTHRVIHNPSSTAARCQGSISDLIKCLRNTLQGGGRPHVGPSQPGSPHDLFKIVRKTHCGRSTRLRDAHAPARVDRTSPRYPRQGRGPFQHDASAGG
jgi:hypothetical protein